MGIHRRRIDRHCCHDPCTDRRLEAGPAVMGRLTALVATGAARKALGFLLAANTITLFTMDPRRAGQFARGLAGRRPNIKESPRK